MDTKTMDKITITINKFIKLYEGLDEATQKTLLENLNFTLDDRLSVSPSFYFKVIHMLRQSNKDWKSKYFDVTYGIGDYIVTLEDGVTTESSSIKPGITTIVTKVAPGVVYSDDFPYDGSIYTDYIRLADKNDIDEYNRSPKQDVNCDNNVIGITNNIHRFVFWCEGCKTVHLIKADDEGYIFNYNLISPTIKFDNDITLNFSGTGLCTFDMVGGIITYDKKCTHDLAGKKVKMKMRKNWNVKEAMPDLHQSLNSIIEKSQSPGVDEKELINLVFDHIKSILKLVETKTK